MKSNMRSNCCNAKIKIGGAGDFIGDIEICTLHFECIKCNEACDVHLNQRKVWTRNPKTQIQKDKRDKQKRKETKKEIEEIGCA